MERGGDLSRGGCMLRVSRLGALGHDRPRPPNGEQHDGPRAGAIDDALGARRHPATVPAIGRARRQYQRPILEMQEIIARAG